MGTSGSSGVDGASGASGLEGVQNGIVYIDSGADSGYTTSINLTYQNEKLNIKGETSGLTYLNVEDLDGDIFSVKDDEGDNILEIKNTDDDIIFSVDESDTKITYDTDLYIKSFQGETNTNITGWIMTNSGGTICYVYPNSDGNGIEVSTLKP